MWKYQHEQRFQKQKSKMIHKFIKNSVRLLIAASFTCKLY